MILGRRANGSYSKVPTDDVIPVFTFDDTPVYRNAVGCYSLRFNDVLDGDKLHAALARLLEIDGWRKLGGRFRLNVSRSAGTVAQVEIRAEKDSRSTTSLRSISLKLSPKKGLR